MEDASNEILTEFISESRDTLDRVGPLLRELEHNTLEPDAEILAVIFRSFHSFKGTASFIGLNSTAALAHSAESLLDLYRRGAILRTAHIELLYQTIDALRMMLDCVEAEHSDESGLLRAVTLCTLLDAITAEIKSELTPSSRSPAVNLAPNAASRYFRGKAAPGRIQLEPATPNLPRAPSARSLMPAPQATENDRSSARASDIERAARGSWVETDKLDELVNLVAELILVQGAVTENPDLEGHEFENLQKAALHLERVTRALQDAVVAMHRVPVGRQD